MQFHRRAFLHLAVSTTTLQAASSFGRAENYPTRTIRIIVPYPPGGPADVLARILARSIAPILGKSVIIEDRASGAGGTIGGKFVTGADPDGYTLLVSVVGSLTIAPSLYKLDYDPLVNLAPIAMVVRTPLILAANPGIPAKSLVEFVTYAKSNPGKINLASPGTGTLPHVAGALFQLLSDIELTPVPYRGSAPAINDLLAGQVQVLFDQPSAFLPHIKAGRLRALGVTSETHLAEIPDVPTFAEAGYARLTMTVWLGLLAPAGTPETIVKRLNQVVGEGLDTAEVRMALNRLHFEPGTMSPQEFKTFMAAETRKWGEVVAQIGIKGK